jgi:hypothetical protein
MSLLQIEQLQVRKVRLMEPIQSFRTILPRHGCTPDLENILLAIDEDARAVLMAPAVALGEATPPSTPGVYILSVGKEITYVGEARGGRGLRDRLSKHLSGDDNHAIQRAYSTRFPDRLARRKHIRVNVLVQWVEIPDVYRVSAVERALICLCRPAWNMK